MAIGLYLLQRPVPPFDFIQSIYYLWGKPIADDFGRIATYNGIGRYIFGDDSISANNGSITDFYTFDNGGIATDPYVMTNNYLLLINQTALNIIIFGISFWMFPRFSF